ncbi:MAG: integration host factor subunit beta [Desulfovibrionaceae bacterium]|nr:integration host factor subunit beta [Desulfovibrionaceae bacterium]
MNKSDLVKAFAENHNLHMDEATVIVDTFFATIQKALLKGSRVEIRGFGSFKVKEYEGYKGRNPKTGSLVNVPAKRLPRFKPGKMFLEILNKQQKTSNDKARVR